MEGVLKINIQVNSMRMDKKLDCDFDQREVLSDSSHRIETHLDMVKEVL